LIPYHEKLIDAIDLVAKTTGQLCPSSARSASTSKTMSGPSIGQEHPAKGAEQMRAETPSKSSELPESLSFILV